MTLRFNSEDITSFLSERGFSYKVKGDDLHLDSCPFCGRKDFHISASSGLFQCFSLKHCGKTGSFFTLVKSLSGNPVGFVKNPVKVSALKAEEISEQRQREISISLSSILTISVDYWKRSLVRYFWKLREWTNRGISLETLRRFKVGYWPKNDNLLRILRRDFLRQEIIDSGLGKEDPGGFLRCKYHDVFTLPTISEDLIRAVRFKLPKDREDDFPGKSFCLKPSEGSLGSYLIKEEGLNLESLDEIIICEGEPDVFSLVQNGFSAVGLPGAGIFKETWARQIRKIKNIYVVLDNDEAGEKGFQNIVRKLKRDVSRIKIPFHDVNDMLVELKSGEEFVRVFSQLKEEA